MDNFREEIIVRRTGKVVFTIGYVIAFITMIFSAILLLFSLMEAFVFMHIDVSVIVMIVISAGMTLLLWRKKDNLRLEYEYTFTNGEMDFAKVLGNKRRKHLLTLQIKNAEQGGPVESDAYNRLSGMPDIKKMDYTINADARQYFIYYVRDGVRTMLILEPSDKMIAMMRHYNRNFADMPAQIGG